MTYPYILSKVWPHCGEWRPNESYDRTKGKTFVHWWFILANRRLTKEVTVSQDQAKPKLLMVLAVKGRNMCGTQNPEVKVDFYVAFILLMIFLLV